MQAHRWFDSVISHLMNVPRAERPQRTCHQFPSFRNDPRGGSIADLSVTLGGLAIGNIWFYLLLNMPALHGIVALVEDLVRAMEAAATPENARALARYFKVAPGSYGEGDIFLGLKLGDLRQLAKPYAAAVFEPDQWLPMLRSPIHEHRLIALVVMTERAKKSKKLANEAELQMIYDAYLRNTSYVNNWDLVDVSCGPIVGGYLLDRDRSRLYKLVRSRLLWDRRIAMVSSQYFLRRGETGDLYRLAEILLPDRHDLIHKAVGWSLREAGKRVDRDELRRFLDQHAAAMPRTTLRYAIEHFDPAERQRYLAIPRQAEPN